MIKLRGLVQKIKSLLWKLFLFPKYFVQREFVITSKKINFIDIGTIGELPSPWRENRGLINKKLEFEPREKGVGKNSNIIKINTALWSSEEEKDFFIYKGNNGLVYFLQKFYTLSLPLLYNIYCIKNLQD